MATQTMARSAKQRGIITKARPVKELLDGNGRASQPGRGTEKDLCLYPLGRNGNGAQTWEWSARRKTNKRATDRRTTGRRATLRSTPVEHASLRAETLSQQITFKLTGVVLLRNKDGNPEFRVYATRGDAVMDNNLGEITPHEYGLVCGAFDRRELRARQGCGCSGGCGEGESNTDQSPSLDKILAMSGDGCTNTITIGAGTSQAVANQAVLSFETDCELRICPSGFCGTMIRNPNPTTVQAFTSSSSGTLSTSAILECECNPVTSL